MTSTPADIAAARSDLRDGQTRLDAARDDLRSAQARLDAARDDLRSAQARLDAAREDLRRAVADGSTLQQQLGTERAKLGNSFLSLRSAGKKEDVTKRIAELEGLLHSNTVAKGNAQRAIESMTLALSRAQATFDTEYPGLKAAVEDAGKRVSEYQKALDTLQGVRAIDFLRRPLQAPITGIHTTDLELQAASEQPVTKVPKTSETSLKDRKFEHFMPGKIKDWEDFESLKKAWVDEIGDRIIPNPIEERITNTAFTTEREFNSYWTFPRQASTDALINLAPDLPLKNVIFTSKKPYGTGVTDEYMVVSDQANGRGLQVTEYKHPGVRFHTDVSVAALASLPPPPEGENGRGPKGNVLKSLIQTYTYMVSDRAAMVKFGAFSNWDFWVFFTRVVDKDGDDVVYVSPWYHRDVARLAWAFFITLAARSPAGDNGLGLTLPVPEWLLPKKDGPKDGDADGGKDQSGRGSTQRKNASGTKGKDGPSGGPSATLEELYPDTTTAEALGIPALLWVQPFQMLSLSDKSHARRVMVSGRDLVAKIVDYYGTPGHSEWSQEDLYELEWNEVRAYHHLRELQGLVVPHFLYHGSDLNQLWASAVTSYEGVSLARILNNGGQLPAEAATRALDALRAIHAAGLIHGDVALRNVVWRERDGAMLWVDFELAKLKTSDLTEAQFDVLALREETELAALFADTQSASGTPVSPNMLRESSESPMISEPKFTGANPTSAKRYKVFPTCCKVE